MARLALGDLRQLRPDRVVAIASSARLAAVEWGGDIHVPNGDLDAAGHVADLTSWAGLQVSAYGSYYGSGIPTTLRQWSRPPPGSARR